MTFGEVRPLQGQRLAVVREVFGYLDSRGNLVLALAGQGVKWSCGNCHRTDYCWWYTGHGMGIRWYCDDCVGISAGHRDLFDDCDEIYPPWEATSRFFRFLNADEGQA